LEKPDDCPVCMDTISETTEIPLECGHWVHKECLKMSIKHICPMCRQPMYQNEIDYVFGKVNTNVIINFENIHMYNNLEQFMNEFPDQFSNQNENINDNEIDWNREGLYPSLSEIENEISSEIVPDSPFSMRNNIDLIIRDIEISPRNNPFLNVPTMLNFVHPDREDDFEEYIMNMIENYAFIHDEQINIFSGDIIIRILSNEIDIRLFSIGFNLHYQPIDPEYYLRILGVMETRIRNIYEMFHQ
jgi:hypothetical protein